MKADFQALKSKKTAGFTVLKQEKQTKKNDTSSNKSKLNEPHKSLNALRTSCIDTFPQMERNSSQLALMNATNGSLPNVNVRTSKRTSDIDKSKVNRVKSDMYQKYPSTKSIKGDLSKTSSNILYKICSEDNNIDKHLTLPSLGGERSSFRGVNKRGSAGKARFND